jgi:hypothetical protein
MVVPLLELPPELLLELELLVLALPPEGWLSPPHPVSNVPARAAAPNNRV